MFWEPADYFENESVKPPLSHLRVWDYSAAQRVDQFISNSRIIQDRVKKYYGKDSIVIHPFVESSADVHSIPTRPDKNNYFLVLSRLVPWKKVDVAVEACSKLKVSLKVVGTGSDLNRLKKMAGRNVEFLGYVDEERKKELLKNCLAVINPQYEDFGIVPLEAMSYGRPVIAYGKGGVTETVIGGETGEFFYEQNAESLINCLKEFNPSKYLEKNCMRRASEFEKEVFQRKLRNFVNIVYLDSK
jgi:glycosyltransferase involved in cell wall biosynthesis